MPDQPAAPPRGGSKTIAGQPWWVWAAGAVALVGGYIYLRNKGAAAGTAAAQPAASSTTAGTSPTGMSWDQFLLFLHDQQSSTGTSAGTSPGPAPSPAPKPAAKVPYSQQKFYSGALGKWMTGAQWHQWHVQHLAHQAKAG